MLIELIERLIQEGRCFEYDATERGGTVRFGERLRAWIDADGDMVVSQFKSGGIVLDVQETIDYLYEIEGDD